MSKPSILSTVASRDLVCWMETQLWPNTVPAHSYRAHSLVEAEDKVTDLGLQMLVFSEIPSIWDSLDFLLFSDFQAFHSFWYLHNTVWTPLLARSCMLLPVGGWTSWARQPLPKTERLDKGPAVSKPSGFDFSKADKRCMADQKDSLPSFWNLLWPKLAFSPCVSFCL